MELGRVSMVSNNAVSMNKANGALCKPNNYGLQADTVCFTGKKQKFDAEGKPKKSSFIHKALVAATGCFIPGMGQAINGQWGKAALFAIGAPIAVWGAMTVSLPLALGVGAAAGIGMFVDAYRNA